MPTSNSNAPAYSPARIEAAIKVAELEREYWDVMNHCDAETIKKLRAASNEYAAIVEQAQKQEQKDGIEQ